MRKVFSAFLILLISVYTVVTPTAASNLINENDLIETPFVEEYIDENGNAIKIITEQNELNVTVSLYNEGILEQQAIANRLTKEITGFSDYGNQEINKKVSDIVGIEPVITKNIGEIQPLAAGYHSIVAQKRSAISDICPRSVLAFLLEKETNSETSKLKLDISKGEAIAAVLGAIVVVVITKTPITAKLLKEMLIGLGVTLSTTIILDGFKGNYQVKVNVKDYYGAVENKRYFTNIITKETMVIYNEKTGADISRVIGTHVTAYGKPTDFQVMLSQTLINWGNATQCK